MTLTTRQTEGLLDALSFGFVAVCVQDLGRRPTPEAIAKFRQRASDAVQRAFELAEGPFGSREPTEPMR